MKVNYQKQTEEQIEELTKDGAVPRLLLHSCCAPCSSYVLEYLSRYFEITDYFYNPNIAPSEEYDRRASELERLVTEMPLEHPVHVVCAQYDPAPFEELAKGLEKEPEGGKRCMLCYRLRLEEAAREAKRREIPLFTTTLTISPMKNAQALNEIGEAVAKKYGVAFLPSDFKKKNGYLRSIRLSEIHHLYRQDFCGCVYSQREAEERRREKEEKR
jgi:predicted adenine nucleotide alpha hydrolase (AANH) superfamily ATPase